MGDVFKEQIVKKVRNTKDLLKMAGVVAAAVALAFLSLITPIVQNFSLIIILGLGFGVYYVMTFFQVEYEYIFTNGNLDIDVIYSKSRRKRLFSADVREFELMAHIDNTVQSPNFRVDAEVRDFSSGVKGSNTYVFLTAGKSKKIKGIIEPNEKMLQAFSTVLTPRKLIR